MKMSYIRVHHTFRKPQKSFKYKTLPNTKHQVSVRCTGAALCRSSGLLQPNYVLIKTIQCRVTHRDIIVWLRTLCALYRHVGFRFVLIIHVKRFHKHWHNLPAGRCTNACSSPRLKQTLNYLDRNNKLIKNHS